MTDEHERLGAWWAKLRPQASGIAQAILGGHLDSDVAEDVVQEVCLASVMHLRRSMREEGKEVSGAPDRLDGDRLPGFPGFSAFRHWALTRVKWGCVDRMRAASRVRWRRSGGDEMLDTLSGNEDRRVEAAEALELVSRLIQELPTAQREVMSLILEGNSTGEIAKALSKKDVTIRKLAQLARARLAENLLREYEQKNQTANPSHGNSAS